MMDDCMRCGTKAVTEMFDGVVFRSHWRCPGCGLKWMLSNPFAGRGFLVKTKRKGWQLAPKGTLRTYGEAA